MNVVSFYFIIVGCLQKLVFSTASVEYSSHCEVINKVSLNLLYDPDALRQVERQTHFVLLKKISLKISFCTILLYSVYNYFLSKNY